jgi:hypothetical protein
MPDKSGVDVVGEGTKIAEGLNSIIDNADYWDWKEMRTYAMQIQPDRKLQKLWDAAPEMLEALQIVRLMLREAGETREGVTVAVAEGMIQKLDAAISSSSGKG